MSINWFLVIYFLDFSLQSFNHKGFDHRNCTLFNTHEERKVNQFKKHKLDICINKGFMNCEVLIRDNRN